MMMLWLLARVSDAAWKWGGEQCSILRLTYYIPKSLNISYVCTGALHVKYFWGIIRLICIILSILIGELLLYSHTAHTYADICYLIDVMHYIPLVRLITFKTNI